MLRTLLLLALLALPSQAQVLTSGGFTNLSGTSSGGNGAQIQGVLSGGVLGLSGATSSQLQSGPIPGSGAAAAQASGTSLGGPGAAPTGGGSGGGGGCAAGGSSTGLPFGLAFLSLLLATLYRRRATQALIPTVFLALASCSYAQTDPFIGQIKLFGGNFAPRGWALCQGQLLPINSNTALFSILGTTYGGDGRTTFGLPSLRGRIAMHAGRGPGLTTRRLGEKGGTTQVTMTQSTMPNHTHAPPTFPTVLQATETSAETDTPAAALLGGLDQDGYSTGGNRVAMAAGAVGTALGSTGVQQSQTINPPSLGLNYIIALVGAFPSRN